MFYLANAGQADSDVQVASDVNTSAPGVYSVDYSLMKNDTVSAFTRLIVVVE